ncbi:hypothetical protein C8R47DRAFT_1083009 [Mycena vitilis]|nr:hypothetical protein C8R47DRAFT_1083009 [Mycena vitilis]
MSSPSPRATLCPLRLHLHCLSDSTPSQDQGAEDSRISVKSGQSSCRKEATGKNGIQKFGPRDVDARAGANTHGNPGANTGQREFECVRKNGDLTPKGLSSAFRLASNSAQSPSTSPLFYESASNVVLDLRARAKRDEKEGEGKQADAESARKNCEKDKRARAKKPKEEESGCLLPRDIGLGTKQSYHRQRASWQQSQAAIEVFAWAALRHEIQRSRARYQQVLLMLSNEVQLLGWNKTLQPNLKYRQKMAKNKDADSYLGIWGLETTPNRVVCEVVLPCRVDTGWISRCVIACPRLCFKKSHARCLSLPVPMPGTERAPLGDCTRVFGKTPKTRDVFDEMLPKTLRDAQRDPKRHEIAQKVYIISCQKITSTSTNKIKCTFGVRLAAGEEVSREKIALRTCSLKIEGQRRERLDDEEGPLTTLESWERDVLEKGRGGEATARRASSTFETRAWCEDGLGLARQLEGDGRCAAAVIKVAVRGPIRSMRTAKPRISKVLFYPCFEHFLIANYLIWGSAKTAQFEVASNKCPTKQFLFVRPARAAG